MACHCAYYAFLPSPSPSPSPPSPQRDLTATTSFNPKKTKPVLVSSVSSSSSSRSSYTTFVSEFKHCPTSHNIFLEYWTSDTLSLGAWETGKFQAVRLLGPPAKFEASKLKVIYRGEELDKYSGILPRTYTLSHCDFTANLTLTISSTISLDQLKGWYHKDDVVAEWKKVNGDMCLHVHCYVSGPNLLAEVAAEFRYHIFSKELPLVLQAVIYGDPVLFRDHPELLDALVRVYFHSSSQKYNRMEYWGALKDAAAEEGQVNRTQGLLTANKNGALPREKWAGPKSIFQALFAFLL